MRATLLAAFLLLFVEATLAVGDAAGAPEADTPTVPQLVERLGDPRYAVRRDAQRRLEAAGLGAFDELRRATAHGDPEIAATSDLLLSRATSVWAWRDDAPSIRRQLTRYGDRNEEERLATVQAIARTGRERAVPALCRLARFELSSRVSREAARVLLNARSPTGGDAYADAIASANAALDARFGASQRPAAQWLAMRADPTTTAAAWSTAFRSERDGRTSDPRIPDPTVLEAIARRWLEAAIRANDTTAASEAVTALIDAAPERAEPALTDTLEALAKTDAGPTLDELLQTHGERLRSKRGLYLRARLHAARGRDALAATLAERAFTAQLDESRGDLLRVAIADELRRANRYAWAEREYAAAGATVDPLTVASAAACWRHADLLQDLGRYGEAADRLAALDQAVNANEASRDAYRELGNRSGRGLPTANGVAARRWLYRALAHREAGEIGPDVAALERALESDPDDADIVIALHRAEFPSDDASTQAFRARTRDRIRSMASRFEDDIAAAPLDPTAFNQWAWLVSNTEGDYAKAVRYSRRSLELRPDDPGLLDTLGRCLYAAGDHAAAVETQRRAVALAPHLQVMRRQLELFETALAAEKSE